MSLKQRNQTKYEYVTLKISTSFRYIHTILILRNKFMQLFIDNYIAVTKINTLVYIHVILFLVAVLLQFFLKSEKKKEKIYHICWHVRHTFVY